MRYDCNVPVPDIIIIIIVMKHEKSHISWQYLCYSIVLEIHPHYISVN